VIDTGIQADLTDFGGRVVGGVSFLPPPVVGAGTIDDVSYDDPLTDLDGHGTHVSGLIGSQTYGVAKNVFLFAIKAVYAFGSGVLSAILGGVQYVEEQYTLRAEPMVINMSLATNAVSNPLNNAITLGRVPTIVAAGNGGFNSLGQVVPLDACTVSPAGAPGAFAVGCIDERDQVASFSNYGQCVQLFSPGANATSLDAENPGGTVIESGTSQACAVTSGVAAIYLSLCPQLTRYDVYRALIVYSTRGQVIGVAANSPNRIVYVFPDSSFFQYCSTVVQNPFM